MPKKRLLTEFGMGSSLRNQNYTDAAKRAISDALWHNSINLAELFGKDKTDMIIDVEVGVQKPDQIDPDALTGIFPYGNVTIRPVFGGLDIPRVVGNPTVMANVAISVSLDLEDAS